MEAKPKPTLSRLDAGTVPRFALLTISTDLLTINLHYASTFWEEHANNFYAMFTQMLDEETIGKLTQNAATMCLTFNHKIGWVPAEYNMEYIYAAYGEYSFLPRESLHGGTTQTARTFFFAVDN